MPAMFKHPWLILTAAVLLLPPLALAAGQGNQASAAQNSRLDIVSTSFEDAVPPAGWVRIQNYPFTWFRTSNRHHTGSYSAYITGANNSSQDEWLVSPALDLSSYIGATVEWYEDQTNWASSSDHHYIMVSTTSQTDPATFTVVSDMTPSNHTIPGFSGGPSSVSLSAYAGQPQVYVAFRFTGPATNTWYIDDARVFVPVDHDVRVLSVGPIGQQYSPGTTIYPHATVDNFGANTETFDVRLEVNASTGLIASENVQVNLVPGESTLVNFSGVALPGGELFDVSATTLLASDLDPSNDSMNGYDNTYTQTHVPMCILFTNAGCVPCVPANQALDAYMPAQGNSVALMRVHVWWPSSTDIMYTANTVQCTALVNAYDVSGVPNLFLDGYIDLGYDSSQFVSNINARKLIKSPNTMSLSWDVDAQTLRVTLHNLEPIMPAEYRLRVAITEDNIHYNGGNGEPVHMQAFRRMYPDYPSVEGMTVSTEPGDHVYVVSCPLVGTWVYNNLRATAYLEGEHKTEILQAATDFLHNIEGTMSAVESPDVMPAQLLGNYPNPFNPVTKIAFNLAQTQNVKLEIYSLEGRHVATLIDGVRDAGHQEVFWYGLDDHGKDVASGTYFYQLKTDGHVDTMRMSLVR